MSAQEQTSFSKMKQTVKKGFPPLPKKVQALKALLEDQLYLEVSDRDSLGGVSSKPKPQKKQAPPVLSVANTQAAASKNYILQIFQSRC